MRTSSKTGREKRRYRGAICLSILLMFAGTLTACSGQDTDSSGVPTKPNPQLATVTLTCDNVQVVAEVAKTEEEKSRGLMYRKSLEEGKGMLFVFDYDQKASFWMKNTSIPLSLAYLSKDGTVTQIVDLQPYSQEPNVSTFSVRYVLEVPQGWFAKVGIKEGDKFNIPPLDGTGAKK